MHSDWAGLDRAYNHQTHPGVFPTYLSIRFLDPQVDEIIERLLEVRQGRQGKQVQLVETDIRKLCLTAKEIFMSQPNLLELEAPIKICGGCGSLSWGWDVRGRSTHNLSFCVGVP
jgi:hypothetical protein